MEKYSHHRPYACDVRGMQKTVLSKISPLQVLVRQKTIWSTECYIPGKFVKMLSADNFL